MPSNELDGVMIQSESPYELYKQIGQELAALHFAESGKLFGLDVLKIDGKVFAGFYQDCMTFKLMGEENSEALKLEGSVLFDPSGRERPMTKCIKVSFIHSKAWHHLAESALEYVKRIDLKTSTRKLK
jgi:hypothetical protein